MSYYELLKFVHVVMAIIWVGGAITIQVLAFRILKTNDPIRLSNLTGDAGVLGERLFAPASGILVIMGVLMVLDSGWDFSDTWIVIGIALYVVSVVIGAAFLSPLSEKITAGLSAGGPPDAALQEQIKKVVMLSRIDLVILVLVVADMVIKPGM